MNPTPLLSVCEKHVLKNAPRGVEFTEPYIPFIPEDWNGILVVGEAQNLSGGDGAYARGLRAKDQKSRFQRLAPGHRPDPEAVGVKCWDDGYLKLAVAAAFPDENVEHTAITHAIPWSQTDEAGKNIEPNDALKEAAIKFWADLLKEWPVDTRSVVTVGKVARKLMRKTSLLGNLLPLRGASPKVIEQQQGWFDQMELLKRYPEITAAAERLGMEADLRSPKGHGLIFYAAHAVSMVTAKKSNSRTVF
jgi:hypothetical protein